MDRELVFVPVRCLAQNQVIKSSAESMAYGIKTDLSALQMPCLRINSQILARMEDFYERKNEYQYGKYCNRP